MINNERYREELTAYCGEYRGVLEKFRGNTILITGAAGLIGSYLADLMIHANTLFETKIPLVLVDRNAELLRTRFRDRDCTLLTADIVKDEITVPQIDYVFHCASNTSPIDYATKPIDTILTNIIGTNNIIRLAIKQNAKRVLFCSSVEAYGKNNGDTDDFTEDYSGYVDCNTVRAGYPSAKRCAEALLNAYRAEYMQLDFVTARIGRIYGPTVILGDAKAPTQFITNAVNSEDIVLKSNGLQEYSWGYVGDCATALMTIMADGKSGEAYNVADPDSKCTLRYFAEACAKAGETSIRFSEQNATEKVGYSGITKATLDTKKLEELGWHTKYHVQNGTERTIAILKALKGDRNGETKSSGDC